jgi:hypothetical protein
MAYLTQVSENTVSGAFRQESFVLRYLKYSRLHPVQLQERERFMAARSWYISPSEGRARMDYGEFGRLTRKKEVLNATIARLEEELGQIGENLSEACAGLSLVPPRTDLDRPTIEAGMATLWRLIEQHTEALREYGDTEKELARLGD